MPEGNAALSIRVVDWEFLPTGEIGIMVEMDGSVTDGDSAAVLRKTRRYFVIPKESEGRTDTSPKGTRGSPFTGDPRQSQKV